MGPLRVRLVRVARLWALPRVSLRGALRVWQRDAVLYRRAWARNLLPNWFEPVLYLGALGFGLGAFVGDEVGGIPYVTFLAPGLAAAAAMNGAIYETTFNVLSKLRYQRVYDAIVTTPVEPDDVVVGEVAWAVTRSVLYGGAFLAVIAALGLTTRPAALLAPIGFALVGLVFAAIGLAITSAVRTFDAFSWAFTLLFTPLFLFSGVFFPIADLPAPLRALAWLTPLHHGVELTRALLLGGDLATAAAHGAWLLAVGLVSLPPVVGLLRRQLVT